jgi:hypothetical protein
LPVTRRKRDLFVSWEERRYMIILERIRQTKSIVEVKRENVNVNSIEESKLLGKKRQLDLIITQNECKYQIIL